MKGESPEWLFSKKGDGVLTGGRKGKGGHQKVVEKPKSGAPKLNEEKRRSCLREARGRREGRDRSGNFKPGRERGKTALEKRR